MLAARGETERARELWNRVLADEHVDYLHGDAKSMLSDLDTFPNGTGAGPDDVAAIYGDDDAARAAVLARLEAIADPSVADMFYLGEAYLMSDQPGRALDTYTGVINPTVARWDESYQMVACARAGEILGSLGNYEGAAKHYDRAGKFWHREFLYDWVLEARKRYFERLKSGDETTPPTLLTTAH